MDLYRALYTFYKSLVEQDCEHQRVHFGQSAPFCPDCGYKIKLLWVMVKCRHCDSKRIPRRMPDGKITPLHKYCRHCGASAFRLVKRESIDAYELLYGLSIKEIDYSEERRQPQFTPRPGPQPKATPQAQQSPFDVVDGQVIRKRYFTQSKSSVWEEPPFPFQEGRSTKPSTQLKPYRQQS